MTLWTHEVHWPWIGAERHPFRGWGDGWLGGYGGDGMSVMGAGEFRWGALNYQHWIYAAQKGAWKYVLEDCG